MVDRSFVVHGVRTRTLFLPRLVPTKRTSVRRRILWAAKVGAAGLGWWERGSPAEISQTEKIQEPLPARLTGQPAGEMNDISFVECHWRLCTQTDDGVGSFFFSELSAMFRITAIIHPT
jgi:hypothetical protein